MHIVRRRNMLALPVERLVNHNTNNNHNHHSHSSTRLSLSPDSNASDSSSTGGESSTLSPSLDNSHSRSLNNRNHHHHHHSSNSNSAMNTKDVDVTMKISPRETSNYSPPNCKMHVLMKSQISLNSKSIATNSNSNNNLKISSSLLSPPSPSSNSSSCLDQCNNNNDKDYGDEQNSPQCHDNLKNINRKSTKSRSRSISPNDIKNASGSSSINRRTCCNSISPSSSSPVAMALVRENNNIGLTVVKSEVDTDDRLAKKEPSPLSMSTEATTTTTTTIHFPSDETNPNNRSNKQQRSDKFHQEKSANANNSINNNSKYVSNELDENNHHNRGDDNRVQVSHKKCRTSGIDHRVVVEHEHDDGDMDINVDGDIDDDEEDFHRTEDTNNSSIDNHNNSHYNNHYHSDNNSGRPPSRPPSSTSTSSSSNYFKSQHFSNTNSNSHHHLKFSIADILRPDFGINNIQQNSSQISNNKLVNRHHGQIFNPFLSSPESNNNGSRNHLNHQKYNNHKEELLSPVSISSSSQRTRNGSVSSTDGNRPYRPSSVHCHSEDSNSSCKREPEVVDDTKVNPPVPKGPLLWPAWVYCTRYSDRPSSGPRSRRIRKSPREVPEEKRPRTAFTAEQLARLKQEFDENRYLTEKRRQDLALDLKLHENQIKIWFQNKRAKLKKSTGTKNGLALQLMAQGLYNHSTVPIDEDEEMEMMM